MKEIETLYKEYRAAKQTGAEIRAAEILAKINQLRQKPQTQYYCTRSREELRGGSGDASDLRKSMAVVRFSLRAAARAEAAGDHRKAETLRAKAHDYMAPITRARRSTRRFITTSGALRATTRSARKEH